MPSPVPSSHGIATTVSVRAPTNTESTKRALHCSSARPAHGLGKKNGTVLIHSPPLARTRLENRMANALHCMNIVATVCDQHSSAPCFFLVFCGCRTVSAQTSTVLAIPCCGCVDKDTCHLPISPRCHFCLFSLKGIRITILMLNSVK